MVIDKIYKQLDRIAHDKVLTYAALAENDQLKEAMVENGKEKHFELLS